LIAARDVGKGRLVVVGDQNIYGDVWIHYYDNFTHALNVFEWLAKRDVPEPKEEEQQHQAEEAEEKKQQGGQQEVEDGTTSCLRHILPKTKQLVLFDTVLSHNSAGRAGPDECYSFFVNFNRDVDFTAHAARTLQELDKAPYDILVLPPLHSVADAVSVQSIQDCLRDGNTVVLLCDTRHITRASALLLHDLVPELTIEAFQPNPVAITSSFQFAASPPVNKKQTFVFQMCYAAKHAFIFDVA